MSMFRPRLRIPRLGPMVRPLAQPQHHQAQQYQYRQQQQRRSIHNPPALPPSLENCVEYGIGTNPDGQFLSAAGVDLAWTQYMAVALGKLDQLTAGKEYETMPLPKIIIRTSRDPAQAPTFNYASMAHNTHFFFEALSHEPVAMPESLKAALEDSFGSIETLRREFIITALAMFGPGFVWLVRTKGGSANAEYRYRLLPTYLAGTPYPRAHYRRQAVDMNTVGADGPEVRGVQGWMERQVQSLAPTPPERGPMAAAAREAAAAAAVAATAATTPVETPAPGGVGLDLEPVLCLNTWEHMWMCDYGILTPENREGKRVYVERWWDHINWDKVESRAQSKRLDLKSS